MVSKASRLKLALAVGEVDALQTLLRQLADEIDHETSAYQRQGLRRLWLATNRQLRAAEARADTSGTSGKDHGSTAPVEASNEPDELDSFIADITVEREQRCA